MNDYKIFEKRLINDGVWEYEMQSKYSCIRYGYEPDTDIFYLYNISTPTDYRNKGYAKSLLNEFFYNIKMSGGVLDPGSFTVSGMIYIKPIIKRLSDEYNVPLINYPVGKDREI